MIQDPNNLHISYNNIKDTLINTPLITSKELNQQIGHNFYFKMDCLQKTGSFKIRAVLNHLICLKKLNQLPKKIVSYSTGNHAIALGYACQMFNLQCKIYLPKATSSYKIQLLEQNKIEIILTETRKEAEMMAGQEPEHYFLHPSNSDFNIAGSGTMCFEALKQMTTPPDAIFASCGGGGLLSGSLLAKDLLSPKSKLFGCEPQNACDAFLSLQQNKIFELPTTPQSIADGLIALKLSQKTFEHVKKTDGILLSTEFEIYRWTKILNEILQYNIEPSAAITMSSALNWLKNFPTKTKRLNILLLISGGNFDYSSLSL